MIASALSQVRAASAARILGTMPPAMTPRVDEVLRFLAGERVELVAVLVAHAVHVGHEDELPRAEATGDAGRRVVGVDVADDAVLVACERGHDRHLAADEHRVEEVAPQPDDVGHEPEPRDPLRDEQPAVHAGQPDRVDAEIPQPGHQLAVDDTAQDGRRDLERGLVRDAQTALEFDWHAQALEPVRDPLAAAVDQHHRPLPRDRAHLLERPASGPRWSSHPA